MDPAKRNAILDSLEQFGGDLTMSEAATRYGVSKGNIGRWAKERRDGKVVRLATVPPPPVHAKAVGHGRRLVVEQVAEALGPRIRGNLRESIDAMTATLCEKAKRAAAGDEDVSMSELHSLARAIEATLNRGADLLAFDKLTDEGATASPGAVLLDAAAVSRQFRERNRRQA